MAKSNIRKWCEETAHEFGCTFTKNKDMWTITQKSSGKVVYQSRYLIDCQKYLLNEIAKYMGKRMGVRK